MNSQWPEKVTQILQRIPWDEPGSVRGGLSNSSSHVQVGKFPGALQVHRTHPQLGHELYHSQEWGVHTCPQDLHSKGSRSHRT